VPAGGRGKGAASTAANGWPELSSRSSGLTEHKKACIRIAEKTSHQDVAVAEELDRRATIRVADPQPDRFRRSAKDEAALVEVGILRYENKVLIPRVDSNLFVRGAKPFEVTHEGGVGIKILQGNRKAQRKVLIE